MRAGIVLEDSSLESVTIVVLLAFVGHRTSLEQMTVGFTVDEADYASIVSQVKNAEFEDELQRRLSEMMEKKDAEQKVQEITRLKESLEGIEEKTRLEIDKAVAAKNLEIAGLQSTIRLGESEKEKSVMLARAEMKETLSKKNDELSALRNAKDFEIAELKSQSILAKSQAELQKTAIKYEYEAKLKFAQEHSHGSRWQGIHILLPPYSQLFFNRLIIMAFWRSIC